MPGPSVFQRHSLLTAFLAAALVSACATGASPSTVPTLPASMSPAPPTQMPTFGPSPEPSAGAAPGISVSWVPPSPGFEPHVLANGLARLANGEYLVLGQAFSIDGKTSTAASSADGLSWAAEPGLSPEPGVTLWGAASIDVLGPIPGPTVVVGSRVLDGAVTGIVHLMRSPGGWTKVADQPSLAGSALRGVIATNDRFVAYGGYAGGATAAGCASADCVFGVGIWTSSDGATWTAALRIPATSSSDETLAGVVSGPRGLVAYARKGVGPESTLIWTSPDGRVWTAAHPAGLDGVGIHGMIGTGGTTFFGSGGTAGYLGVGTLGAPGPTIFRSPDGIHWTAVASGPSLEGVIKTDDGFVGWNNSRFDSSAFVRASFGVWTSLDGTNWQHANAYAEFYSGGMVADGLTVLSIGSPNDPNPVWIGTLTVVQPN
jgi:hypothetical protein